MFEWMRLDDTLVWRHRAGQLALGELVMLMIATRVFLPAIIAF